MTQDEKDSSEQDENSNYSPEPLPPLPKSTTKRIGLDAEALSGPEWYEPHSKMAVCFGWGTETNLNYMAALDMTAGIFDPEKLHRLQLAVQDSIVVAHNANYDLDLLNGVCLDHGLDPLGTVRYIDTMNTLKSGMAYRRTLKDLCKRYGIQQKTGSPDWRLILQRDRREWGNMREYNLNDVVCALQLEKEYRKRGIPAPVKIWRPRRG